jgi:hypothetical protein
MIGKGVLVRRKPDDWCSLSLAIRYDVLQNHYPPQLSVCIVTSNPKETDLSKHDRNWTNKTSYIMLKKAVDVICDGHFFGPCALEAFEEIKK